LLTHLGHILLYTAIIKTTKDGACMATPLSNFYRHNLWANLRLVDALLALDPTQLELTEQGTFGSIFATLTHLVVNEERYLARLRGESLEITWYKTQKPDLPTLREHLVASGNGFITYAENYVPDSTVTGVVHGETVTTPTIIIMLQAINHATQHRTDITTILAHHGLPTPDIDGWAYEHYLATDPAE
jgi:uncharacterized damage-inducible protein DinB